MHTSLKGVDSDPVLYGEGAGADLTRCEQLKLKNSIFVRVLRGGNFASGSGSGGGVIQFSPPPHPHSRSTTES